MESAGGHVRRRRSTVAVTGATTPLGRGLLGRLVADLAGSTIVAIAADEGDARGVTWRSTGNRGISPDDLAGVETVVHLDCDRSTATPAAARRAANVNGTEQLLDAAVAAGVRRVVLLTSAMVYGANPTNPVPLDEDTPLAPATSAGLIGDWLAMERAARERAGKGVGELEIVSVRPASLIGLATDSLLPGLFESVRLLAIREGRCYWQFCHTDDLIAALSAAAEGRVSGAVTVGCDGWMDRRQVESISGMRSVILPPAVAFATAERLHRIGVLSSPSSDLHFLIHPWVIGSQRLHATGWKPAWTNQAALAEHLAVLGERVGRSIVVVDRKNATRAAAGAGATLAVVGSLALARARARRR